MYLLGNWPYICGYMIPFNITLITFRISFTEKKTLFFLPLFTSGVVSIISLWIVFLTAVLFYCSHHVHSHTQIPDLTLLWFLLFLTLIPLWAELGFSGHLVFYPVGVSLVLCCRSKFKHSSIFFFSNYGSVHGFCSEQ